MHRVDLAARRRRLNAALADVTLRLAAARAVLASSALPTDEMRAELAALEDDWRCLASARASWDEPAPVGAVDGPHRAMIA